MKRFAAARRPGTYLRIIEEGELGAGDRIGVRIPSGTRDVLPDDRIHAHVGPVLRETVARLQRLVGADGVPAWPGSPND